MVLARGLVDDVHHQGRSPLPAGHHPELVRRDVRVDLMVGAGEQAAADSKSQAVGGLPPDDVDRRRTVGRGHGHAVGEPVERPSDDRRDAPWPQVGDPEQADAHKGAPPVSADGRGGHAWREEGADEVGVEGGVHEQAARHAAFDGQTSENVSIHLISKYSHG